MTPSEEIMQFLKDNPTFYLATVDGYLPRVRPLGFAMWYKDHLCLGIGKHKAHTSSCWTTQPGNLRLQRKGRIFARAGYCQL